MKLCVICQECLATSSAVYNGKYYKRLCPECLLELNPLKVSSGSAEWDRMIDMQDHEADVQQPYNSDGSINTRFAKLYPKQATALFTPEQLRKAEIGHEPGS